MRSHGGPMTAPAEPRPDVLAPLRHGPFRALAAGRTLMYFGNGLATVALGFAVLDATGSLVHLGLVVGARSLANVVLLLFGGVLADRLPRALVLQGGCALAALSQGLVAAAVLLGAANLPLLVVLSLVNGAAAAANLPASAALTPQTVPRPLLRQANALVRVGVNIGMLTGMSIGTAIVGGIGPGWAIAVDAALFALAGVCFALLRLPAAAPAADGPAHPLRELAEGWTEFVSRPWVWIVVLQFMVVNATWSGTTAVLGPAIADATFGRVAWGLILMAYSAGLILGGLLAARWQPRRALLFGVVLVAVDAVPMLGLTGTPVPLFLFAAMFLTGVAVEQFTVAWEVSVQENVPPQKLARVYSYDALGSFIALPAGEIAAGPLAEAVGTDAALEGMAALLLVATGAAAASRSVRGLTRR
ncbi:MFS transporter [Nocardiopsis sediminis]|uniref:MFS transporter n=1 Tax=Nocardiopsis sediminis TaxID=1778267 RepID=A0ABV8FTT2_9ACTN